MQVITSVQDMLNARTNWAASQSVGLVPTMGYLHAGHLALVSKARAENQFLVASIFVNPAQFGPHEDLARYPRDLPRDLHLLEDYGVDAVFTPAPSDMYPSNFVTYVDPTGPLAIAAEGASRPGHFRGVATVVLKLFQIIQPQRAYFGQKDAQQVAVISRMVSDLNLAVKLRILPTIREADGLAMSSRNAYLNPARRATSTILYRALLVGQQIFESRPSTGPAAVIGAMQEMVAREAEARLDYIEIRDPDTFLPLTELRAPALLLLAVSIGSTRLIDNFLLRADGSWDRGTIQTG
ncbi:MAG TPA: pantoate--beta-alanine ligase [Ktedonobacteraceae bacterium]|nr:pantoate--beta-alanine ligase [Ktedonobacteraceae bacterium]